MPQGKHILGRSPTRRVFGTAKVGDRGQIVIPKEARDFFNIHPGDTLLIWAVRVRVWWSPGRRYWTGWLRKFCKTRRTANHDERNVSAVGGLPGRL